MTDHHFETHEPVALHVENARGHVIVHATDTTESSVRLDGPDAEATQVELDGRHLVVVAPSHRGGTLFGNRRLDITVVVPSGSDLTAKLGSADLDTEGALHTVRVRSGSGDLTLDVVTGAGLVETGSGEVRVGAAEQDLRVKSGSGGVTLGQTNGELAVSTGSGNVLVEGTNAPTAVKTGSGDLEVARAGGDVSLSTGSGDLTVRSISAGRVKARGASGDIHIGVRPGVPVWTDVTSVSGHVSSTLESAGRPEPGQAHVEIRAKTASGDITLVPA